MCFGASVTPAEAQRVGMFFNARTWVFFRSFCFCFLKARSFSCLLGMQDLKGSYALPFSLSCVQSSCAKWQSADSSQSRDKGWAWVTLLLQCGVNCEQRGVWVCSLCLAPCWAHGNRSWCGDGECWVREGLCRVGTGISVAMETLLSAGSWLCFLVHFHAHGCTGTKIFAL